MDEITLERSRAPEAQGRQTLKVSGRVTIAQALGFQEELLGALAEADELQLDLSGVTAMDLSGLQLLCAAHLSAETAGKTLRISDGANEIFRGVAAAAGFLRHVGCARDTTCSCIWQGGEN